MSTRQLLGAALLSLAAAACTTAPAYPPSDAHIRRESAPQAAGHIPAPVQQAAVPPKPKPAAKTETYSVVVNNVRVQELLFALARDAKLNVDIHPGISGTVTLNAIDQTLPQLLNRISKQVDMRFELDGPNLVVMPDTPFLRTYRVDYVNLSRDVTGTVTINTQIASTGGTAVTGTGTTVSSATGVGNSSTTEVKNIGRNRFWDSLEKNIKDLLHETDKILPEGSSETVIERADLQATTGTGASPPPRAGRGGAESSIAGSPNPASYQSGGTTVVRRTTFREAASVIVNPETGVVTVRATARQHEKVQEFLDSVTASARRQVLIEATIAEVSLSDNYQQGIDWQYLRNKGSQVAIGQGATTQQIDPVTGAFQNVFSTLPSAVTNTLFTAAFRNGGLTAAIRLLESFGNVKVLSSPKLSVLNNQTALLKVVDNVVFFNVKADTTQNVNNTLTTVTTTPQSVSVGLVMSVTPQISEADTVVLNVRPTISRVTSFVSDPNPNIPAGLTNQVPQIQTREMESVMRVANGEIAVLGGLMQDQINYTTDAVPGVSKIPFFGNLFSHRNDTSTKTELVIFLRPIVIHDASVAGDFRSYRDQLPDKDYFGHNPGPPQPSLNLGGRP
jgi:MSHA type pilus biogenesis protein MshL